MTNSVSHFLNISTLATWLSVAGFGVLGGMFQLRQSEPRIPAQVEPTVVVEDFQLGDVGPMEPEEPAALHQPAEFSKGIQASPPDLPTLADVDPLPEIPDFPSPSATPPQPQQAKARAAPIPNKPTGSARPSAGSANAAAGISNASRLASGSMPPPSYPSVARRNGQTGTVMVEFTVDAGGRVISAHAKSSSGWPLLDNEAVRTVLRWRFPAGGVMKLQRPIVFQLR